MNYLAHAYLSFGNKEILVGNMISDFVKGKKKFDYPPAIQKGIMLHRSIDQFTDDHPATKAANVFFKPAVRLYAGAFTDVVYDHFLAADPNNWKEVSLADFSSGVYSILSDHHQYLPERFQQMFPHMKAYNWLYNYRHVDGIEKSFGGVVRRAAYLNSSAEAFDAFKKNYEGLHELSGVFIADVKKFASLAYEQILKA